jgi:hypothetical protein
MAMENAFTGIAQSSGRHSVVVFDRGLLDVKAYLPPHHWHEVLKRGFEFEWIPKFSLSKGQWQELDFLNRYDSVIHLVTAANGAEKHYDHHTNAG